VSEQLVGGRSDGGDRTVEHDLVVCCRFSKSGNLPHVLQRSRVDVFVRDSRGERWAKSLDASTHTVTVRRHAFVSRIWVYPLV
jgi:hypothetical protein